MLWLQVKMTVDLVERKEWQVRARAGDHINLKTLIPTF